MKKKKNVCPQCQGAMDPATATCAACGYVAEKAKPARKKGNGFLRFLGVFFTVIFSIVLTVTLVALVAFLFAHALSENVALPALGPISGDWLAGFFAEWYSFAFGGIVALIPLLILVLINTRRMRRFFLATGWSSLVAMLVVIAAVIVRAWAVQWLPGQWHDALADATAGFRDFGNICAVALGVLGATCLSVYYSIVAATGGKKK